MYDLIIVGGGPGGVAAGVYAARKKIKTLLITDGFGGQSLVSADIQNWIGTKSVSGFDLGQMLEGHLREHSESVEIMDNDIVEKVGKKDDGFVVLTRKGKKFETRYALLVSGSRRKKLGVPGEKEFDGKGVHYCSICDAPLFKDKIVAVIGGGNAGLESVIDLLPYASKIYLMVRSDVLKGDAVTQEKVKAHNNVEIIYGALAQEIIGKDFVNGLRYKDVKTAEIKELKLDGVFVEIGIMPNSEPVRDLVALNDRGEVIVDPSTQSSSVPGIWAAGDVSNALYKQNNISAGDAVKAILNIHEMIRKG
ncbi:MAG: FAD-dependent oxidoreductase [Candidatus Liptonbacteria bacterium]|nr:FAD-dependent oxidoreductase [Candidatus Liptonbacteria bacterium]